MSGTDPKMPESRAQGAALERELAGVARAARRRLLFHAVGTLVACLAGAALVVGLVDFALRLPMGLRLAAWIAGLAGAVMMWRAWMPGAWRFRPTPTQVALRLEETPEGRGAGLSGVLAAALELASGRGVGDAGREGEALAALATARAATVRARGVLLKPRRTRLVALGLLAAGAPVAWLAMSTPRLAGIGARRVLTPWASVSWPRRTEIVDATRPSAHSLAMAIPLRAVLVRSPRAPGRTDVAAHVRVVIDGERDEERRELLTHQGRREGVDEGRLEGELFERLLDPRALIGAPSGRGDRRAGGTVEVEYWFESGDDRTPTRRVRLVEPPAIASSAARITPPGYAAGVVGAGSAFVHGEREAGDGTDARSTVGPVLAGSRVELTLNLNKAMWGADLVIPAWPGDAALALADKALPGARWARDFDATFEASRWRLAWTVTDPMRVPVLLEDEHGLRGSEEAAYRFDAAPDRDPTVSIVEPSQDEHVLATAVVGVSAEARDDVGLSRVSLRRQGAGHSPDSVGADAEPTGEPVELAAADGPDPGSGSGATGDPSSWRVSATLDLGELKLQPGDEVWLTSAARDLLAAAEASRPSVVSSVRRLRVIGEGEFVEQVRAELASVREAAQRLEQEQSRLSGERAGADVDQARAQGARQDAIRERVGPVDDVVRRLGERVARNRLEDRALTGLLEDAGELLDEASASAGKAGESLREAGAAPEEGARREALERAGEEQAKVEASLTQLADMLDRGQDGWVVRRSLEKLLTEQRQVEAQTRAAEEGTRGQGLEQLSRQDRDELERLSRRQGELAQRAAQAMEALEQRARSMESSDKGQAEAMRQAAKTAREQGVDAKQREAAEQIRQNQTGRAQGLQQQASKAIERMLKDLDRVERARDEALRRLLADVASTIQELARRQEVELEAVGRALGDAGGSDAFKGLGEGMRRLHADTLAAGDLVGKEMRQAARLIELLGAAGSAQAGAVAALRASPADGVEADERERVSLARLRDAIAEIERMQEQEAQRDADRRREEVRQAYGEALEKQAAINEETKPLAGRALSRRERDAARKLGDRQAAVADSLRTLKEQTKEIGEARMFDFAHERLEDLLRRASGELAGGEPTARTARDQASAAAVLRSLVEALRDANKKDDDFRQAQDGGGGGGGGGQEPGLLPPIAQLKLLRGMQVEAGEATRAADGAAKDEVEAVAKLQRDLAHLGEELARMLREGEGPGGETESTPEDGPGAGDGEMPGGEEAKP